MTYESYNAYLSVTKSTPSDIYKDEFQELVNAEYENTTTLKTVLHNGNSITVRVVGKFNTETLSKRNDNYQKIIFKTPDYEVKVGDIFEFDGAKWICTDVTYTTVSKSCTVTKANNELKVYKNQNLLEIPCVLSKTLRTWEDESAKYFRVLDNQLLCTMPNNSDTQSIEWLNQVFKIGLGNYECISVDDVTQSGLLILTMQSTTMQQPEIPDLVPPTEDINIVINGSNTIQKGKSATYTAQITQDGETIEGKTVLFSLENVDGSSNVYATITSQDGIHCTIKAENFVGKYIKIIATLLNDDEVVGEKVIQIVGLF